MAKYGSATTWTYGTEGAGSFDVVESVSGETNYGTEITVKDHNGDTVGLILDDIKGTVTVSGLASSAPYSVGEDDADDPSGIADVGGKFIVTSVRANMSNEDFVKYEYTATGWANISDTTTS